MAEMQHLVVDNLFLLVHTKKPPSNDEWRRYLDDMKAFSARMDDVRTLVFTAGGGPNPAQRGALNSILGGKSTPASVVSSAAIPRMIVKALSFFNPKIKAFRPGEVEQALTHLGLRDEQIEIATNELQALLATLGIDPGLG